MYVLDFPSEKSLLCNPVFWFMFPVMDYFSFVVIVLVVFGFCFLVSILLLACNSSFCIYCSFTYYFEVLNCVFSPSYFRIHVPVTLCWGVSHFTIKAIFQLCLILELLPPVSLS